MTNRPLPLRKVRLPNRRQLAPYLDRIDASGVYTNFGPLQREFEARLAGHFGCLPGEVLVLANATVALTATLDVLNVRRGAKCLMPSLTFIATPSAAIAAGLAPFFMDVDRMQWTATPAQAEEALAAAGGPGEVAAVIPVSTYGAPPDLPAWAAFQDRTGIPVVIDAAWCFDSTKSGPIPQCISLHATKVFGAGEGGVVLWPSADMVMRVRRHANFGILADRQVAISGFNGKLSEYGSAVGLAGLDGWAERRRETLQLEQWYMAALSKLPGVTIMPGMDNTWAGGTIAVTLNKPAAAFTVPLAARGIEARHWWGRPCHRQIAYSNCGRADLAVTESLSERIFNLPFWIGMSEDDIAHVAQALSDALMRH